MVHPPGRREIGRRPLARAPSPADVPVAPGNAALIRANALAKRFGDIEAVRSVTFTAPDGAITGLLGPNGAGKTTTLRMIASMVRPSAGSALVDGIDPAADPRAARARLGVLSDSRGIY